MKVAAKPITNPIQKFMQAPSRSKAIKAKCAECVGCTAENAEPGFRSLIGGCAATKCPLWQFRPYQGKPESQGTSV